MPDALKSGVESMSGIDMNDVKVHYNSTKPAQLNALAYTQGNQIHISSGQEKHLPHEAWHVVQQKQGRVRPTMQMKGTEINDDNQLEKEADEMGNKANAAIGPYRRSPALPDPPSNSSSLVVQRRPEDALETIKPILDPKIQEVYERIMRVLENSDSLIKAPYKISPYQKENIRQSLLRDIDRLTSLSGDQFSKPEFIGIWNRGIPKLSPLYITQSMIKKRRIEAEAPASSGWLENLLSEDQPAATSQDMHKPDYVMDDRLWNAIGQWFNTPLSQKSMTPDRKLDKLQGQSGLLSSNLPEDFWVALKLFFLHTAAFAPVDRQGRDITNEGEGTYYRTSENPVKDLFKESFLKYIQTKFPDRDTKKKTVRPHNEPVKASVQESGALSSNLLNMETFKLPQDDEVTFGMYISSQASHTGSLGFPSNAMKSVRAIERLKGRSHDPVFEPTGTELQTLIGKVNPELLQGHHEGNYHDFLLHDRAALVQKIAQWMLAQQQLQGAHIQPIQSEEHPSIIIYHPHYVDGTNEKEWREAWLVAFNNASATLGYSTRLNRRGSFGFLYPTISSVGGPVRIWPGLVPSSVFQSIMRHAIVAVYNWMNPQASSSLNQNSSDYAQGNIVDEAGPLLHQEALRTAVKHTFGVLGQIKNRPSGKGVYEWVLTRLNKNLLKAQYLLTDTTWLKTQGAKETHYLKSTLVIENLMEYTYMLQSLVRQGNSPRHDPYPQHVANALLPANDVSSSQTTPKSIQTFYLDSGMQAIVAANQLAKAQIATTGKDKTSMQALDLNTYFEYASIHKGILQLAPFDFTEPGRPDIISADLNPVLTAPNAKKADPAAVLQHYSESNGPGKTIPIIDITNSNLSKAAKLELGKHYENFIVLESLTKHQQLGADKFTMGRLNVIGSPEFIQLAKQIVGPMAKNAYDPLWMEHRLSMDNVFYGNPQKDTDTFQAPDEQDFSDLSFLQLPFFKDLTHEEVRKNEDMGMLMAVDHNGMRFFKVVERGVTDHWFRTNSCGFLTLDTTRETLQHDLIQTIEARQNQQLQRIVQLIGDEIQNTIIRGEQVLLSQQYCTQVQQALERYNSAEEKRVKEISEAKKFLSQKVGGNLGTIDMNISDAIAYLQQYQTQDASDIITKLVHILSLRNAQTEHTQASQNLNNIYHSPELAVDYLANNLLDTQQLGHNTARAWAIARGIELHIWTHAQALIQEISPQDVVPGNPVIHMLHTSNRTHFQELIPV